MIEINLAPGAEGARPARQPLAVAVPRLPSVGAPPRAVGAGALALLLLLALGHGLSRQGARREELAARVEREVADSTRFATTLALVQTLQARQDTVRQKIGLIREVDQRRYVWPHLLDEISRAVPPFTWLTEIGWKAVPAAPPPADGAAPTAPVPAGPAFALQGHAGSTQALTRLMKNLEGSPFIREVTLVTSEQVDRDGRTLHRFTLEARYERPDSAAVATVPIAILE